jgi:hypothetical protein
VIVAVTGPDHDCTRREQARVGEVWDRHFFIQRTGDEVVFMTARGPDVYYQGTVAGDDFTAEDRGGRAGPGRRAAWAPPTTVGYPGAFPRRTAASVSSPTSSGPCC